MTIPGTINGLPVSSIGTNAFLYSSLTSVMIPNSVASVGDGAFYRCTRLTNVTVGNSVTNIGSYAFWGCTSLIAIAVDPQNTNYSSVDGVLFNKTQTTLIQCPAGKAGSYTVPNSVTSIESYAFWGCTSLIAITVDPQNTNYSSVDGVLFNHSQTMLVTSPEGKAGAYTMPNSVTTIGANGFHDCTRLTSITIGNSVTNIGSQAFYYCTSLSGFYFQGNAPSLGDSHVFDGDNNATVYYLPGTTGWGPTFGGLATVQQCDYTYTISNSTITITRYIGSGGAVTIPSTIGGLTVTTIGDGAFSSCTGLSSLTIPDSVTAIGDNAFSSCASLTNIAIPNGVTSIGSYAFWGCTSLFAITVDPQNTNYSSVDGVLFNNTQTTLLQCPAGKAGSYSIPNGVTSIGYGAFSDCTRLTSVAIPNRVSSIGDWVFYNCTSLTNITIPNNVISIPEEAFFYCFSLTSITIGNSVTNIGSKAFYHCTSLRGVYFEGNAPSLGDSDVFEGANNATVYYLFGTTGWGPTFGGLSTALWCDYTFTTSNGTITITRYIGSGGAVTIPSTIDGLPVTCIGTNAFCLCANLTSITIPDSVTSIGNSAFAQCHRLTCVTIPNSLTSIGEGAFSDCTSLTNVTIPNSLASIADFAFYDCTSLTSVTIPNSVISIGADTFYGCNSLAGVTIPDSVTSIGNFAFSWCSSLTSVTIGTNVTNIGDWAFSSCTNLASVTIPNSVISIGDRAFYACTSLTAITVDASNPVFSSVAGVLLNKSQTTLIQFPGGKAGSYTIPNSVTSLGLWACQLCTKLTSITIPNSITNLGDDAFGSCYGLTNATLANGVTSTGPGEFRSCTSLTSVTIPNGLTSFGNGTFSFCGSLTSITIPNGVTNIGDNAFFSCTSLTNVTIPNSVTNIGDSAFHNCTSLSSVTIGNGVTRIGDYAFYGCASLTGAYFQGNAPSLGGSSVFAGNNYATVYYLPGTTGWGATFGGLPTALWPLPTIQTSPQTQTAEAGSAVGLRVEASSSSPLFCLWHLNDTNLLSCSTNQELELTNVQFAQSGAYTVVVTNGAGAITSAPAMLNVIAAVERRPAEGVQVMGEAGSLLNVDYAESLSATPNWLPLDTVSLVSTSQYCFDVSQPLPPQRFYRAWQTGTPGVIPSLSLLGIVPAISLTGSVGHSVRVDYINQFGPIDAWGTLATVTMTNTSQLYFDTSARGQPARLYRVVPLP